MPWASLAIYYKHIPNAGISGVGVTSRISDPFINFDDNFDFDSNHWNGCILLHSWIIIVRQKQLWCHKGARNGAFTEQPICSTA